MPKMKTKSGAKKRFRVRPGGTVKRGQAYKRHILTKKSTTRKRVFRQLWIARINAASRGLGITYSKFMAGLKKAHIDIDRKVLSDMAIHDPAGFASIDDKVKAQLA